MCENILTPPPEIQKGLIPPSSVHFLTLHACPPHTIINERSHMRAKMNDCDSVEYTTTVYFHLLLVFL